MIANTLIKHKRSRLISSRALNGQSYQINFIIVRKKLKPSIQMKHTRAFLAADVGSDHVWVMSIIIVQLFRRQTFTFPASLATLLHHHYSTVPPSLFSFSIIIVPLSHHHCSTVLLFLHDCSTVPTSYNLQFTPPCSTYPTSDVLLFYHLSSTVRP